MAKVRTPAGAYLRTSSAANVGVDRDSERRQKAAIQAFAKRAGFEIADGDWYYDAAVSGADPIEGREGFARLLDRIGRRQAQSRSRCPSGREPERWDSRRRNSPRPWWTMAWQMIDRAFDIRCPSHAGTRPRCRGRSAMPVRFAIARSVIRCSDSTRQMVGNLASARRNLLSMAGFDDRRPKEECHAAW
jgi:hypothetical protein